MGNGYFKTPNGLELLRDWSGGTWNEGEYMRNEIRARGAAARLLRSGVLVFERGDKPRTAAEFFDGMPYTSTSDFAAVWARGSWQISRRNDRALRLDGIALTDAHAVAVWTRYDENGDEVGTEYETI